MRYRFLSTNENYFFESTSRINIVIDELITTIQTIINDNQQIISINNFDACDVKI